MVNKIVISKKRIILFSSILIFGSTIFTIFFIELIYRCYLWIFTPVTLITPKGEIFNPNSSGEYRGGKVSIDQFGFRNGIDKFAWQKPKKVMLIGDSVGFGMGIDDEYTISHLLNNFFKYSELGFINFCNPGYDTFGLRNRLYVHGTKFKPWHLIIWMYYINDAKLSLSYFPPIKPKENFKTKLMEGIYFFLKWPYALKPRIDTLLTNKEELSLRNSWDEYYKWCISAYQPNSLTREVEERFIVDIINWTKANNVPIFFVVFPSEQQFFDGNTSPQDFIKELSKKYNFPVIDLMPDFMLWEKEHKKRLFLDNDYGHLNHYGSFLTATIIKERIILNEPGNL